MIYLMKTYKYFPSDFMLSHKAPSTLEYEDYFVYHFQSVNFVIGVSNFFFRFTIQKWYNGTRIYVQCNPVIDGGTMVMYRSGRHVKMCCLGRFFACRLLTLRINAHIL